MSRLSIQIQPESKADGPKWTSNGRTGRFESQQLCYKKVLSIDPNETRAKANLITVFKETGEFEKANDLINSLGKGVNYKLPI